MRVKHYVIMINLHNKGKVIEENITRRARAIDRLDYLLMKEGVPERSWATQQLDNLLLNRNVRTASYGHSSEALGNIHVAIYKVYQEAT